MSHSPIFDRFVRAIRIARFCDDQRISTAEGLERMAAAEARAAARRTGRREFLLNLGKATAAGALATAVGPGDSAFARGRSGRGGSGANIGIVGAGVAGLVCADVLRKNRVAFSLYEAGSRVGGRQFSFNTNTFFPGQSAERGGEFIDTGHKTLIAYARRFNLAKEDVTKDPDDIYYHFLGARHDEAEIVDEFRAALAAMQDDYHSSSGTPTADVHNDADIALDYTTLREFLETRVPGALGRAAIDEAYVAEYGRETTEQSCLNFLLFIHLDKRSKFTPFGVFSDERYHIVGGNDLIAKGIHEQNLGSPAQLDMSLVAVTRRSSGDVDLTFKQGSKTIVRTHAAVVIALPFTVLRDVQLDLDPGNPLEAAKIQAIRELGYGNNAKMMIQFNGRHWKTLAPPCTGAVYSDLENCQTTWETNFSQATAEHAVLTDYSGGARGARLDPSKVQTEALRFLTDLDVVLPGALGAATRDSQGKFKAHLEHWPSNPLTKGSYTCYLPGQFTTIAGNEGKPVGNILFAGEHTNSFYDYQGFMEGAARSGADAAAEILARIKAGSL